MAKPRNRRVIPFETLQRYFDRTLHEACKELGVSVSCLKSTCRVYGIKSWPYRKIQSLQKLLKYLKEQEAKQGRLIKEPYDSMSLKGEVVRLSNKLKTLKESQLEEFQYTVESLDEFLPNASTSFDPCKDNQKSTNVASTSDIVQTSCPLERNITQWAGFEEGNFQVTGIVQKPQVSIKLMVKIQQQIRIRKTLKRASILKMIYTESLRYNLPELVLHLGTEGIKSLGPSKLAQLAEEYYHVVPPRIENSETFWNEQRIAQTAHDLSHRLKELQEEKRELEIIHSSLARKFREASLRELKR
eukprot:jgi/Galph1/4481/GphlegSOOS_G3207.1